jgi:hypothetical protein
MYLDLIKYLLFIFCAVYIIPAERGIMKMPTEKQQQEFEERMRNKAWKYTTLTLAYAVIGYSIFLVVKIL